MTGVEAKEELIVKKNEAEGRYELEVENGMALLEYVRTGRNTVRLTHTEVPLAAEGRGIGSHLVREALSDIDRQGLKVDPRCGFVVEYIRRHPEWSYLVAHKSEK